MNQAELIRDARCRAGLSTRALAREVGLSQPYIVRLESSVRTTVQPETVDRLAAALDLTPDSLYLAAGKAPPDIMAALIAHPSKLAAVRDILGLTR